MTIIRHDYSAPPPGRSGEEARLGVFNNDAMWAEYKAHHKPPGLKPHPWAALGGAFRYAFVTPNNMTILGTVGASEVVALSVAWRWYDVRLALVATGKMGEWPQILNDSDSSISWYIDTRVRSEATESEHIRRSAGGLATQESEGNRDFNRVRAEAKTEVDHD